jgi:hypothetical protein
VGAIPTVGGPLGALTKFLWKDGQPNSLFNQMKDYVDKLVPEALTDAKLTDMQHRLKAITDDLHLYDNMVGTEKPGRLIHALGAINDNTEDFVADDGVNRAAPDRTLSYFVNFALLKLAALQEQLVKDKEYWPDQDGKTYAQAHDTRQKELYDAIKQVTDRAAEIKKKLMERRLEKLFVKNDGYETTIGAQDEFGWAQRDEVKFSLARDDFCDWNGPSYDNHNNPAARADLARRRDEVTKAYGAAVDAILEPLNAWRALLPEEIARRERERQEIDRQRRQSEYEQTVRETCRGINC